MHLFYHSNLPSDTILKIWVIWALDYVNSSKRHILFFIHGLIRLVVTSVKPWIWYDFGLLYSSLLLIDEVLQVSISDQLVQENL